MADFTVRWADWKGGDWGVRDPAKADNDTFKGINVYRYDSGLLGVRAGLKQLPVTGLPTHPVVPGPLGFYANPNAGELLIVLNKIYSVPMTGGAAATNWASWPSAPTGPIRFQTADGKLYALVDGQMYRHDSHTAAPVAIDTQQPLSHFVRWGYYFVGIDRATPWRLRFSTVDSGGPHFGTWGANNYIDIGNNEPITALNPILNALHVGKQVGWNIVTGVLGTEATVRGAAIGMGPIDPRYTVVTTDNRIVYWPTENAPAFWNGERVDVQDQQHRASRSFAAFTGDTVIVTTTSRRLILANDISPGTQIMSYTDGAWSYHNFGRRLAGLAPGNPLDGMRTPADIVYAAIAPTSIGEPVVIGVYNYALDRPGHTTDTYAAPSDVGSSDLVHGLVTLPSYWEPIGRQVRVRSVIVQFRKWPSGVDQSLNEIEMRVDVNGGYGRGPVLGTPARWYEPCSRSAAGGADDSWRVNLGDQGWGNGFQVAFPKLVGVALREVIALCDVRTERL